MVSLSVTAHIGQPPPPSSAASPQTCLNLFNSVLFIQNSTPLPPPQQRSTGKWTVGIQLKCHLAQNIFRDMSPFRNHCWLCFGQLLTFHRFQSKDGEPFLVCFIVVHNTVADLGFPRGGGANSPGGGAPTYDFAKISQKLHEIERIWTPGGRVQNFTM